MLFSVIYPTKLSSLQLQAMALDDWNTYSCLLTEAVVKPILAKRPINGILAKSVDPDQMPQNTASDQGLDCLH